GGRRAPLHARAPLCGELAVHGAQHGAHLLVDALRGGGRALPERVDRRDAGGGQHRGGGHAGAHRHGAYGGGGGAHRRDRQLGGGGRGDRHGGRERGGDRRGPGAGDHYRDRGDAHGVGGVLHCAGPGGGRGLHGDHAGGVAALLCRGRVGERRVHLHADQLLRGQRALAEPYGERDRGGDRAAEPRPAAAAGAAAGHAAGARRRLAHGDD